MVALLSPGGAFRDVMTACGLGLAFVHIYFLLKLLLGLSRPATIVCDALTLFFSALLYRAAAAGVFEGGTMRWYTFFTALFTYFIGVKLFSPFFKRNIKRARTIIFMPFVRFYRQVLLPISGFLHKIKLAICAKIKKTRAKPNKSKKRDLQKQGKMLYNA